MMAVCGRNMLWRREVKVKIVALLTEYTAYKNDEVFI
jgi:hypothetical protein